MPDYNPVLIDPATGNTYAVEQVNGQTVVHVFAPDGSKAQFNVVPPATFDTMALPAAALTQLRELYASHSALNFTPPDQVDASIPSPMLTGGNGQVAWVSGPGRVTVQIPGQPPRVLDFEPDELAEEYFYTLAAAEGATPPASTDLWNLAPGVTITSLPSVTATASWLSGYNGDEINISNWRPNVDAVRDDFTNFLALSQQDTSVAGGVVRIMGGLDIADDVVSVFGGDQASVDVPLTAVMGLLPDYIATLDADGYADFISKLGITAGVSNQEIADALFPGTGAQGLLLAEMFRTGDQWIYDQKDENVAALTAVMADLQDNGQIDDMAAALPLIQNWIGDSPDDATRAARAGMIWDVAASSLPADMTQEERDALRAQMMSILQNIDQYPPQLVESFITGMQSGDLNLEDMALQASGWVSGTNPLEDPRPDTEEQARRAGLVWDALSAGLVASGMDPAQVEAIGPPVEALIAGASMMPPAFQNALLGVDFANMDPAQLIELYQDFVDWPLVQADFLADLPADFTGFQASWESFNSVYGPFPEGQLPYYPLPTNQDEYLVWQQNVAQSQLGVGFDGAVPAAGTHDYYAWLDQQSALIANDRRNAMDSTAQNIAGAINFPEPFGGMVGPFLENIMNSDDPFVQLIGGFFMQLFGGTAGQAYQQSGLANDNYVANRQDALDSDSPYVPNWQDGYDRPEGDNRTVEQQQSAAFATTTVEALQSGDWTTVHNLVDGENPVVGAVDVGTTEEGKFAGAVVTGLSGLDGEQRQSALDGMDAPLATGTVVPDVLQASYDQLRAENQAFLDANPEMQRSMSVEPSWLELWEAAAADGLTPEEAEALMGMLPEPAQAEVREAYQANDFGGIVAAVDAVDTTQEPDVGVTVVDINPTVTVFGANGQEVADGQAYYFGMFSSDGDIPAADVARYEATALLAFAKLSDNILTNGTPDQIADYEAWLATPPEERGEFPFNPTDNPEFFSDNILTNGTPEQIAEYEAWLALPPEERGEFPFNPTDNPEFFAGVEQIYDAELGGFILDDGPPAVAATMDSFYAPDGLDAAFSAMAERSQAFPEDQRITYTPPVDNPIAPTRTAGELEAEWPLTEVNRGAAVAVFDSANPLAWVYQGDVPEGMLVTPQQGVGVAVQRDVDVPAR